MVNFAKNLVDFIAACGKKHVVLLSSLDFGRWQQIDTSRYLYGTSLIHLGQYI